MGMRTVGDKMHSHNSNCIYSVANLIGTLSSSLCQSLNSWLYSGLEFSFLTLFCSEFGSTNSVRGLVFSVL